MNLVKNGSFETPIVTQHPNANPPPTGNWGYESNVPYWNTDDPQNDFEIWRGGTIIGNHAPCYCAPGAGVQNLEILAHAPATSAGTTVWQNVKTKINAAYRFVFLYTPRPSQHSTLTVAINDVVICAFDLDGTTLSTFNWMQWSMKFIAAKNMTKLSFNDVRHPSGGSGTHIDAVGLAVIRRTANMPKF